MGKRIIERRLRKTAMRLRSLRSELEVLDEHLIHLGDDAADAELRALVSESPVGSEPRGPLPRRRPGQAPFARGR